MGNAILRNTVYAVKEEVTENTYVAPASATEFLQVIPEGTSLTPAKETLQRQVLTGSIGQSTPRTGIKTVSGALVVEARAADSEGGVVEYAPLLKGALGSVRSSAAITINDADSGGTHTTTRAYLPDADANKINVGDVITIKISGDYHTSPVTAVSNTAGNVYIDILVAAPGAFVDGQVIAAFRSYVTSDTGHPSLSISKWVNSARLEQATGCRVSSMSLEGFETGQLASFNFGIEGLAFGQSLSAPPFTPSYQAALPPIILNACVYQDGVQLPVNSLSISLENTLGFVTSTCSPNGRTAGRITERVITGSIDPYKQDDSLAQFNRFNNGTEFSLFGSMYIPSTTAGEYGKVVGFYMPKCLATEINEGDQDGVLKEEISFQAARGADGLSNELFITIS